MHSNHAISYIHSKSTRKRRKKIISGSKLSILHYTLPFNSWRFIYSHYVICVLKYLSFIYNIITECWRVFDFNCRCFNCSPCNLPKPKCKSLLPSFFYHFTFSFLKNEHLLITIIFWSLWFDLIYFSILEYRVLTLYYRYSMWE